MKRNMAKQTARLLLRGTVFAVATALVFAGCLPGPGKTVFTVTFDPLGGTLSGEEQLDVEVEEGQLVDEPALPTKTDCDFDGWYTDNGTFRYRFDFNNTPITTDIILYAEWVDDDPGSEFPLVEMVQIRSGSFTMGDDSGTGESDERPAHRVTVSAFKMGRYEVTQEQFEDVMGYNPSWFDSSPADGEEQGERPVERVSWLDAVNFCNALSEIEGRTKVYTIDGSTVTMDRNANGYRLPTEAEWEYACRAGTTTQYSFGDDDTSIEEYAWIRENSGSKTHEVGIKKPNPWGLYDMHGNVWEWCWDWYDDMYYQGSPDTNPEGAASGSDRAVRGGSWGNLSAYARSADRVNSSFGNSSNLGFRIICK
jgi:uncharacterized repeat protein (TIGR02543 family)